MPASHRLHGVLVRLLLGVPGVTAEDVRAENNYALTQASMGGKVKVRKEKKYFSRKVKQRLRLKTGLTEAKMYGSKDASGRG